MQIKKVLSGTTRLRVSRANLGRIEVPLPSKDEQIKFVAIVEQADKSKFELRQAIEKIDKVMKSLIN
jgi:type I restriction enzyme S subunit